MLPKQHRLPSYLIPQILKKGKRFSSSNFCVIIYPFNHLSIYPLSRFAILVPAKLVKLSTRRNLIKRRIKAALISNLPIIKKGYSVIILVKNNITSLKYSSIKSELDRLLIKAELINPL